MPPTITPFSCQPESRTLLSRTSGLRTIMAGVIFVTASWSASCGPGPEARASTVRDSAGVSIIEISESAHSNVPTWSLSPEPIVSVGQTDGPPEYQFYRIMETLRLDDGMIVVADNGSASVRFYRANGAFISSSGRQGAGPGEYRNLRILGRYGADSLIAWDPPLRRATILATDGSVARSFEASDFGDAYAFFHGAAPDGSLVGTIGQGIQTDTLPLGAVDIYVHYIRLRPNGQIDSIGVFLWNQGYVTTNRAYIDLPFGKTPVYAATSGGFYYGSNRNHEIKRFDTTGQLTSVYRIDRAPRELSEAAVAAYIDERLEQVSDVNRRQGQRRLLTEIAYPEQLPAFQALRIDALGNLWLADYDTDSATELTWWIYGADGTVLANATTPAHFDIREVGADYVLGVLRDELGVEYVVQYRLSKE